MITPPCVLSVGTTCAALAYEQQITRLQHALEGILMNFTPERLDTLTESTCGTDAWLALAGMPRHAYPRDAGDR